MHGILLFLPEIEVYPFNLKKVNKACQEKQYNFALVVAKTF